LFSAPLSIQHVIAFLWVSLKLPFSGIRPDETAERIDILALNTCENVSNDPGPAVLPAP
jgi:hypothetical protein